MQKLAELVEIAISSPYVMVGIINVVAWSTACPAMIALRVPEIAFGLTFISLASIFGLCITYLQDN